MSCAGPAMARLRLHWLGYSAAVAVMSLLLLTGRTIAVPEPAAAPAAVADPAQPAALRSICLCSPALYYLNVTAAWFYGLPGATPAELAVNATSFPTLTALANMCHQTQGTWANPRDVAGAFTVNINIGWTERFGPLNGIISRIFSRAMCRAGWMIAPMATVLKNTGSEVRGIGNLSIPEDSPRLVFSQGRVHFFRNTVPLRPPGPLLPGQLLHNFFPNSEALSDKGRMYTTLLRYADAQGSPRCHRSLYDLVPTTFRMYNESECKGFYAALFDEVASVSKCSQAPDLGLDSCLLEERGGDDEPWWIIKDTSTGMGKGMHLLIPSIHMPANNHGLRHPFFLQFGADSSSCGDFAMDDTLLDYDNVTSGYYQTRYIVQSYERNPLLLRGYKFNVRAYAFVVNLPPFMAFFHPGPVELARTPYAKEDPGALSAHISSLYVPKDEGKDDDTASGSDGDGARDGGKRKGELGQVVHMSFDAMEDGLGDDDLVPPGYLNHTLVPAMKRAMVYSLRAYQVATGSHLDARVSAGAFRILSFDFLITEDLHVWLMEVNENPAVGENANPEVFSSAAKVLTTMVKKARRRDYAWPDRPPHGWGWDFGTLQPLIWAGDKWQYGTLEGCE
eukprot:jgi/Mesvir1/7487/Mv19248-RA.1